jgi:hypothetical protein
METSGGINEIATALAKAQGVGWYRFHDNYTVSDEGEIYSFLSGKILKPSSAGRGYRKVSLCKEGHVSHAYVHHIVAEAFIGERPTGHEVAHLDGNASNNRIENLVYATHAENEAHKKHHGTSAAGENNGMCKFSDETITSIREAKGTMSQAAIGRKFGVSPMQVSRIMRGLARRLT